MASQMFMPRHTRPQHRKFKRGNSLFYGTLHPSGRGRFAILDSLCEGGAKRRPLGPTILRAAEGGAPICPGTRKGDSQVTRKIVKMCKMEYNAISPASDSRGREGGAP